MKNINYFPANLKYLLTKHGYSQAEFAKKLGKDRTTVGVYVKGTSAPDHVLTIKIAEILGVSMDDLFLKDLSKENNFHVGKDVLQLREKESQYSRPEEALEKPLGDLIKKIVELTTKEIKNDVVGLRNDQKKMAEEINLASKQINYIYDALQNAEISREIKKAIDKIRNSDS